MLRSMSTAVSSLNIHQTYLDVIANNLSNANTTGFKAARVLFQDQFSQLISAGASSTSSLGGINPTQVGLGAKVGSITPNFTQGVPQSTGYNLDLAIQGDGFFVYGEGTTRVYSREGSLIIDPEGMLVNGSSGLKILGWMTNSAGEINSSLPPASIQISTDAALAQATSNVTLVGNLDSNTEVGGVVPTTMGVYDSLGELHTITVQFVRTDDNEWTWEVADPGTADGSGTLTFTNGQSPVVVIDTPVTFEGSVGAEAEVALNLDFSSLTMLSMDNTVQVSNQDGLPSGNVTDLYISPNEGGVYLVYSNGIKQQIGQLALAKFINPSGLISVGNSSYQQGLNSGEAQLGTAGTGGRGKILPGYREASNVDMAQEFTNMILAQRGFQASSRVITTSDEMLQELVNLKR
jgi:flagellar hook protein FlgE